MTATAPNLIAVDIGNSRMKIGRFAAGSAASESLPEPSEMFDLPITHATGEFDGERLAAWCQQKIGQHARWLVASVHRRAADRLADELNSRAKSSGGEWPVRRLTHDDIPLSVGVDAPARVGIDRLLGALAANRLRARDRPAIIVDLGTAITVDLVEADGTFAGGAILPGIAMSARALHEQTDALPHVAIDRLEKPPLALGKSTTDAIESGLFWGAVGAIRELILQLSLGLSEPPELFLTGGASRQVAELLSHNNESPVRHVPHLVLSGIAVADMQTPGKAGG